MALHSCFPSARQSHIDLKFLRDLPEYESSKPYHISGALPMKFESSRTNIEYQVLQRIRLFNLRGEEHKLSIAKHGFQIIEIPEAIVSLDVRHSQKQEYIERLTKTVQQFLGAPFALCYDCRFRSTTSERKIQQDSSVGTAERPDTPAEVAHIDLTMEGAARRARRHLTEEEADKYLNENWRLRIVNIWRPFNIVNDFDLLCCDFSTVNSADLVAVDRVSTEYVGEVYMLKPREYYNWYWIDHQMPNEATLFLSYDSHPQSGAPYCPHTSAKNPNATALITLRESVELRMIVLSPIHEIHD